MPEPPKDTPYVPMLRAYRGEVVESIHYGALAVAAPDGRLLAAWGDPMAVTFMRSSAKPFQALPLVESGALETFGIDAADLALVCSSHSGTDRQAEAVAAVQAKTGVAESELLCGVHMPLDPETARRLASHGLSPTPNRHNCSGKHTGMLALAKHLGAPAGGYLSADHPVQQRILQALAEMSGEAPQDIRVGIDGCSAPNFAMPLLAAARAYARLADPSELAPEHRNASERVFRAMTGYPENVAGPGRLDTLLMQAVPGVLAKGGAEGYQGLAIRPEAGVPEPLGVALKISDGDLGHRALGPIVVAALRLLGVAGVEALADTAPFGPSELTNFRGLSVGRIEACMQWTLPRPAA
jgi:L-asparaginase II